MNNDQDNNHSSNKKNEEKENIIMKSTSTLISSPPLDWRSNDNQTKTTNRPKSHGISPKIFHNNDDSIIIKNRMNTSNNDSQPQQQTNINDTDNDDNNNNNTDQNRVGGFNMKKNGKKYIAKVKKNVDHTFYTKYQEHMEFKRIIFRQYTTCKTWPLQQRAMSQYHDLIREYGIVINSNDNSNYNNSNNNNNQCDDSEVLTGESSSSGNSSADHPEIKKRYTNDKDSPTKSQLRKKYNDEFVNERKLLSTTNNNDTSNDEHNDDDEILRKQQQQQELYNKPALWSMEPRIWSKESSTTGTRKYITSHIGHFLDWYWRKCEIHHRHCYEMILENTPCRLYIDIEYSKKDKPNITDIMSEQLLNELYSELSYEINIQYGMNSVNTNTNTSSNDTARTSHDVDQQQQEQQYIGDGVCCDHLERHHIVDLDSTTSTKFSRHWIIHIPSYENRSSHVTKEVLFPDAISVGKFMKNFIGRLADEKATGILKNKRPILDQYLFIRTGKKKQQQSSQNIVPYDTLSSSQSTTTSDVSITTSQHEQEGQEQQIGQEQLVHNDHDNNNNDHDNNDYIDEMTCFIDLGVYTRNRLFRLLGSFKYGKTPSAALRIANQNQYKFPTGFDNGCFYQPDIKKKQQCLLNDNNDNNNNNNNNQQQSSSSILDNNNHDCKNKIKFLDPKKEEKSNELDMIPTAINCEHDLSLSDRKDDVMQTDVHRLVKQEPNQSRNKNSDPSSINGLNDYNNGQLLSTSLTPNIDTIPSITTANIDYASLADPVVIAKSDWTPHAEALACTLVVPLNVFKLDYLILPKPSDGTDTTNNKHGHYHRFTSTSSSSLGNNQKQGTSSSSPYPILDEYVLNHLAIRGGIQGTIQKWLVTYCDNQQQQQQQQNQLQVHQISRPALISYHMLRNRWCGCVGRQHKSNNIMWNIDLMSGPPYRCYQTCWDIDCRRKNFSGCNSLYLPESVSDELQELLLDEQLSQIDLDDLTQNHNLDPVVVSSQEMMNNIDDPSFQRKETPQSDASLNQFDSDEDDLFEQALANLDLSDIIK